MEVFLVLVILVLLFLNFSKKITLMTYIAWMVEKNYDTPQTEDLTRLGAWVIKNKTKDIFRKS